MSVPEIFHRSIEVAAKQIARRHNRGWKAIDAFGPLTPMPGVKGCLSQELVKLLADEVDEIRAGRFHLLGATWPKPTAMPFPPRFWNIDPVDGKLFAQHSAYCFDISFRHSVNTQEIKRIWELNRLQFIVPLAADAAITNDQRSIDFVIGLIRSWMEGNPPFRGLSWVFGIELSLRVISVALTLSIIGVERLDAATQNSMVRFFFAHVDWIRRFPSLFSSANNHRIAELAGLVVGTTMAPGIPGTTAIREDSWRALLVEIDRQIYPDGVGAEQSPGYTAFSIELFLMAAVACGRERNLPSLTASRLSAWAEQSLWLMDTNGRIPAIGDFDDCRVIATTQAPESRYVASIVAAVASCIGRPDLAPPAKDTSFRDVVFGSAENSPTHLAGMRSFTAGGYSVIRSMAKTPAVLILDHGPIGYLSIAAHGHADALSVWLSADSQPIIVDAGTYLYHSNRNLRDIFRKTAVHNTLMLDGASSSEPSGPFNWTKKANAHLVRSETFPVSRVVGEHDGYAARYGVRHQRTVEFDGGRRFIILDELLGAQTEKNVTISFLLDPTCQSEIDRARLAVLISRNGHPIARLVSKGPMTARIVRGDETLGLGWVSPSFGVRVPTDQIIFEGRLNTPSKIEIELL